MLLFGSTANAVTADVVLKAALHSGLLVASIAGLYVTHKQEKSLKVIEKKAKEKETTKAERSITMQTFLGQEYQIKNSVITKSTGPNSVSSGMIKEGIVISHMCAFISAFFTVISAYNLGSIISNFM